MGVSFLLSVTPNFFKISLFFSVNTTTAEKTGPKMAPLPTSSIPASEALFTDKKYEVELTDELNNARKKRRRSSASIE